MAGRSSGVEASESIRENGRPTEGRERRLGVRIINHADDLVIVSRGPADEALAWLRWIAERLG